MRYLRKSSGAVLIALIMLISVLVGVTTAMAHNGAAKSGVNLYYFVNVGSSEITEVETAYRLNGTLGNGDQAYAEGWGYTTAGTAAEQGTSSVYASYVIGSPVYKFDLPAGAYQIAVGVTDSNGATISASGAEPVQVTKADRHNVSLTAVSDGSITVSVTDGKLCYIAVADENAKILIHADTREGQVVPYGEVSLGEAVGHYSDGTIAEVAVNFDNLNAKEVNKNFGYTIADGVIDGTDYSYKAKVVAMPKDLVYFVNAGSETGLSQMNDPYYNLNTDVLAALPDVINQTHDQQYNGSGWGYDAYSAGDRISCHESGTAYPFNTVRCTDSSPYGIGYNFELPQGKYNIFLGTLTHWHPRAADVKINNVTVKTATVGLTPKVEYFTDVEPQNGKIHLGLYGSGTNEGMIAFIGIQPATEDNKTAEIPATPTTPDVLGMGETTFEVGGLTVGSKLQVSMSDKPYSVLFETMVTEPTMEITIDPDKITDIYKLSIAAISNGGASQPKTMFITDVSQFDITLDNEDWTGGDVVVNLSANAASGASSLTVTHNFFTETFELDGKNSFKYAYTASENGEYEFTVYSNIGAYLSRKFEVANIDSTDPVLTVSAATKGIAADKTAVTFGFESIAGLKALRVYQRGTLIEELSTLPEVYSLAVGEYTFVAVSESGKTATDSINISGQPNCFSFAANIQNDYFVVELSAANGKEIARIFAYQTSGETAKRLTVTGTKFNAYEKTSYIVKVEYTDGTSEITTLNFAGSAVTVEEEGCNTTVNGSALLLLPALLILGITVALRKKVVYNNIK